MITIYTLTEERARDCLSRSDLKEQAAAIIEILQDIAYQSGSQDELTGNLTLLRNVCIDANRKDIFDRCLGIAKDGGIDTEDMDGHELRFKYNTDDFANSEEPYREVFDQPTAFLKQRALDRLAAEALKCGYRGFKATYKAFEKSMRQINTGSGALLNPSDFPQQPLELECGEWHCDSSGVSKILKDKVEYACLHPIMPVERLTNIDNGEEKLRVAFLKGRGWRSFVASKTDLFDSSKIIKYAGLGVSVTTKSAKLLSEFLCDVETRNQELIPEIESVSRLGYIGGGEQFSPYVDDVVFDGDINYGTIYDAISQKGDYTKWLNEALKCRSESLTAHIMIAASFASPLIGHIGCLPFFVHLWGVESGTGKTVALMLAASVWGNPDVGQYIQTFNSTQVSCERTAAFLNNVPMCIDELQLSKDSHGHSKFDVYQLAQGVGRGRGNRSGGIDTVPTWSLCILTTGESPLTSNSVGAGAVNRVIDIECKAAESVIKDGFGTSSCIKQNYGHAGRQFIEAMTAEEFAKARDRYAELFKELASGQTTEKQAMAAAILVLADELADKLIFKTGQPLTVGDISGFLKEKSDVSAGQRGYDFVLGWVSANSNKMIYYTESGDPIKPNGEIYGIIEEDWVYINVGVFRSAVSDAGFDPRALLSWLKTNRLIDTRGRRFTKGKRLNGVLTECIALRMKNEAEELEGFVEIL